MSESRQSSEEMAQELFANIEQFTKQAKKAAESIESAVESKVIKGRNASKEKFDDMDNVRKNVVDDFKTALKSLGDSNDSIKESKSQSSDAKVDNNERKLSERSDTKENTTASMSNSLSHNNVLKLQDASIISNSEDSTFDNEPSSLQTPTILNSFDMYTLASQTQEFFGGLLGNSFHYNSMGEKTSALLSSFIILFHLEQPETVKSHLQNKISNDSGKLELL